MRIPDTVALVLAGGAGSRMGCLTEKRPKPVLPVGGTYRLIDISLSNLAHSHISDVGIVQEYLPGKLNEYLAGGRAWDLDRSHGGLQPLPPFQGGPGEGFANGNADSLQRQRGWIEERNPDLVLVMSADQLYTMNYLDVITTHLDARADLTIVTTEIQEDASRYSVVEADEMGRVTGFAYKPDAPTSRVVATEVFVYRAAALLEALDLLKDDGLEDYGHELLPWFVENRTVVAHRHHGYWLDLGTVQSYWTANLQLVDEEGASLDDPAWPIWSSQPPLLPARVAPGASISHSLLSTGSRIQGDVSHSVIGKHVVVEAGATVRDSVLLDGVRVAAGVTLVNCIVDEGAVVSGGSVRGSDDVVTVINAEGLVDRREKLDPKALLPRSFRADADAS